LYSDDEVNVIIAAIKSCITKLVDHYATYKVKVQQQQAENSQVGRTSSQEKMSLVDFDDEDSFDMKSELIKNVLRMSHNLKNEFHRYLAERIEDRKNKNFDILE
ncbi:hypothetical protein TorRG33x02_168860, partial [Trema orientale]